MTDKKQDIIIKTIRQLQKEYKNLDYYSIKYLNEGAMNIVYEVILAINNIVTPFIFRVFKGESDEEINIDEYYNKLKVINKKFVTSNKNTKCLFNHCKYDNIGCSYCIFRIEDTVVEIMEKYDMALKSFMVSYIDNKYVDIFTYQNECNKDIINILEFNKVVKYFDNFITYFRKNNIGHGDLKPENILIKVNNNKITKLVIADLDGLCINDDKNFFGNLRVGNNVYSCGVMQYTNFYSYSHMFKATGKDDFALKVVQNNDLYALSMIILMLWFGYKRFFEIFLQNDTINKFDFENRFFLHTFFDNFTQKNRTIIISNFTNEINKIDDLKNKIDDSMNKELMVGQLDKAKKYLLKCLNYFITIYLDNTDRLTTVGGYKYKLVKN